jgi:hypothetical protein
MTHKTFFIVTLLLSLNGFAQWNYSSTLPTSGNNDFVDIDFILKEYEIEEEDDSEAYNDLVRLQRR